MPWADGETHVPVEPRRAALARWSRCWCWCWRIRVVVKVEVDGGRAADVGVAAQGVVLDGFGRVEREEREGRAEGLFGALHLEDCGERETWMGPWRDCRRQRLV